MPIFSGKEIFFKKCMKVLCNDLIRKNSSELFCFMLLSFIKQ